MRCVDCKFHKAFPTTNIHWCEATKKHKRISDEDAYVDAPCKVADRKTEPQIAEELAGGLKKLKVNDAEEKVEELKTEVNNLYKRLAENTDTEEEQTDCSWK